MSRPHSSALFARARRVIPGGVHSPVRAFGSVDDDPVYFARATGSQVVTADGDELLDLCMSWGPLILGHADEGILQAVMTAARRGLSYGACHEGEVELSELIASAFGFAREGQPQVRLVSSGTEAVMTAVRLARGATGRPLLVKFDGGYHGHSDSLLVKAGSGLVTQPIASSAGVTERTAHDTLVAPLDDLDAVAALFAEHGDAIGAIIIEPMPANNGLLIQRQAFLEGLRALCDSHGALLIFDEVISGFRLGFGGYGEARGVRPDLVTLGKIIGGGMPIGAVVGPDALMGHLAPLGPVYQAGTLSGNPVSVAAGLATLRRLSDPAVYQQLEQRAAAFEQALADAALPDLQLIRQGSVLWLYAAAGEAPRAADRIDPVIRGRFARLHARLLRRGFYLPPSAFEVMFLSMAHTEDQISDLASCIIETWPACIEPG